MGQNENSNSVNLCRKTERTRLTSVPGSGFASGVKESEETCNDEFLYVILKAGCWEKWGATFLSAGTFLELKDICSAEKSM